MELVMSTFVTGVYQSLLNISFKQFVFNQLRSKSLVRDLKKQFYPKDFLIDWFLNNVSST